MSRILARVTRGRIRIGTTKAVLVLATAGALYFGSGTTPITPPVSTGTDGIGSSRIVNYNENRYKKSIDKERTKIQIARKDDEDILVLIKLFMKCLD